MQEIERITEKMPCDLTEEEVAFLRARKYYLSAGELEKFAEIFLPSKVKPEVLKVDEVEQPKKSTKNSK